MLNNFKITSFFLKYNKIKLKGFKLDLKLVEVEIMDKNKLEEYSENNNVHNLIMKKMCFDNYEEREEYLEDMVNENRSLYVRYEKPSSSFEESTKYKDIEIKISQTKENLDTFPETMLNKLKEQKSSSKGCSNCKSSISRDYLVRNIEEEFSHLLGKDVEGISEDLDNNTNNHQDNWFKERMNVITCPICSDEHFIISETDNKRLKGIKTKIEELKDKKEELRLDFEKNRDKDIIGLVGYFPEADYPLETENGDQETTI